MIILVSVNNRVLSEGLKKIINDHFDEAIVRNHYLDPKIEDPDIVLFNSRDQIEFLKEEYQQARFVCLDLGLPKSELACLLFCHNIQGIITPGLDEEMFCKALRAVGSGEIWLDQSHLKAMLTEGRSLPSGGGIRGLSEQDQKIVRMVVAGLKNKEIADRLCLSEPTIKTHLTRIYKTLKVGNRSSLAALAAKTVDVATAGVQTLVSIFLPLVLILPPE